MVNNFELKDTKYFLRDSEVEMEQFAANGQGFKQLGYDLPSPRANRR
jgi:hypothetical protein